MLLPAKGRHAATLALLPRLISTAGAPFNLVVIVDGDKVLARKLAACRKSFPVLENTQRVGYWHSLKRAAAETDGEFIVNLANDLLPGTQWLQRALDAYRLTFGEGEGLIGFNDGVHFGEHAAHALIKRSLLRRWYGDDYWPLGYDHTFGDAELSTRAQQEGRFAVAQYAVMFHDHPYTGGQTDAVYALGQAQTDKDKALFYRRMNHNWQAA